MPLYDKILLRKRSVIETINDELRFVDKFLSLTLFLGRRDEGLASHAVSPRLFGLLTGAEFVKQVVC